MKKLVELGIVLLIIFGLANTNPGIDKYAQWCMVQLNQQLQTEQGDQNQDPLAQLGNAIINWGANKFGPDFIKANTKVDNYIVATLFTTAFNGEEIKVLGVMNNFIPISRKTVGGGAQ